MTTTHTPGPWNWNGTCLVAEPTRDYPDGCAVAKVFNESDVALIAAAPDLLVIVRALIDIAGTPDELDGTGHHDMADLVRLAQAAIARATGANP